jgi:glucose/arabinose dehydrogenase
MFHNHPVFILPLVMSLTFAPAVLSGDVIQTEKHRLRAEIIVEGLDHPWSLAFLPSGDMLVTERNGALRRVDKHGTLDPRPIEGLPQIHQHGQGGLSMWFYIQSLLTIK